MKKIIKITESELVRIVQKVLTEMPMGVPDNITETASEIYNAILVDINKNINPNSQETSYNTTIRGNFHIKDFNFDTINIEIAIEEFSDDVGFKPTLAGAAIRGAGRVENDKIIRKVDSELDILFRIAVGGHWNFGMIVDLFKSERSEHESSLAHELMHAFDHYKYPEGSLKSNAEYSASQSARLGNIDAINHFNFLLYFTHQIEMVTRASELYSYLKSEKITKEQFKEHFLNHKMIKILKECRDYTFSNLVTQLGQNMDEINRFINHIMTHDTGYPHKIEPNMSDIQKIHIALDFAHQQITNHKIESFHEGLSSSVTPFTFLLPPELSDKIMEEKQNFLDKFVKEARKFKNYRDFYEYEIKKLNFAGNKAIKKLSKLYDMVDSDKNSIVNWDVHHKINKTAEKAMERINELFKDEPVKFDPNKKKRD